MKDPLKTCLVCRKPLPETATKRRQYCTTACKDRAVKRKAAGNPIADAACTPAEAQALQNQLRATEHENRRLRILVRRLRVLGRKHRSTARYAQKAIETAQRQTELLRVKARLRTAKELEIAREHNAELELELLTLRTEVEENKTLRAEHLAANTYAQQLSVYYKQEMERAQQTVKRAHTVARMNNAIAQDYTYFARWFYGHKSRELWDQADFNRLQRLKKFQGQREQKKRR